MGLLLLPSKISYLLVLTSVVLLLLLLLLHAPPTNGEPLEEVCDTTANYTANSTYQSNLNRLFTSLSTNGSISGFSTDTVGQFPNQIYGLILCRGDTNTTGCRACLDHANTDILQLCPYNKGAVIWYDLCFLRYSNQLFFSTLGNSPEFGLQNNQSVSDPDRFNALLGELMQNISNWAAYNSTLRFATGEVNYSAAHPKIYGLAQCTWDMSPDHCSQCLGETYSNLAKGQQGARDFGVRCNVRYEFFKFYNGPSTLMLASPPVTNGTAAAPTGVPPSGDRGNKKKVMIIVVAAGIPLLIALFATSLICIGLWRRRSTAKLPDETKPEEITSVESILFDLSILRTATTNFSDVNKLGEGGFGSVYKGILPNGREIAVKRLSTSSSQGLEELKNELVLVAKLQHRNLIRLLGVCLEEQEKLLVYEYMPNRSLDIFLFDPIKHEQLNWARRYKIIEGLARGLVYLHEDSQLKIIHRDLKASNVMLDADMNPKISDFGLAKLFGGDQTQGTTSRVVGTFGYMAPEYAMHGKFSMKSDVFSFGVLVLEIVTGRKNSYKVDSDSAEDLISFTWEHWTKGTISQIIDPSLGEHCPRSQVLRCIHMALLCVQEDPAERPKMSTLVLMLNSYSVSLQAPSHPAFCIRIRGGKYLDSTYTESDFHGGRVDRSASNLVPMSPNEVTISEIEPR